MVTPDAPVNVVKKAHTRTAATAVPPGSHPARARNTRTSRSGVPPLASSVPASVKSGMVGSVSWLVICSVAFGTAPTALRTDIIAPASA